MLDRKLAQAELKKLESKEWITARLASAERLPGDLRGAVRTIFGVEEGAAAEVNAALIRLRGAEKRRQELFKALKDMSEATRSQFFEVMAPGLGIHIERAWQMMVRLPYQGGFARKPFRAPQHPEASISRRLNWLISLLRIIGPYQQNVAWFAAWAPHFAYYGNADELGILLAAALDGGGTEGEEVFQILCASGRNEHEIGGMGRHVTRALLCASRPDGWEFVEKMLLAAQREEGLRQVILETADEAHPTAFRRMLQLILENNLARFSSTVRAFDVWLGYKWDAVSVGVVNQTIEKMLLYLDDRAARDLALKGADAEQAYLALWAHAFEDAVATVAPATELLKHANAEHRFVAAEVLHHLQLLTAHKNLLAALDDADLRVVTRAALAFQRGADNRVKKADLFERLEKLLPRYPEKPEKLQPAVWPWTNYTISRELIADALHYNLGERPASRLIPHLPRMSANIRAAVIGLLAAQEKWDEATRDTLFALIGDASRTVREAALRHLAKCQITPADAPPIERLLDRKSGDLRRGALTLLAGQADGDALASADRLLANESQPRRQAGLELLRQMVATKRCEAEARDRATRHGAEHPKLNETERRHIEVMLSVGAEPPKLSDALGLVRHEDRTWVSAPVAQNVVFHSAAARRIVSAIDELFKTHAQQVVSCKSWSGEVWTGLLSDTHQRMSQPNPERTLAEDREYFAMADVWEKWWETRGPELRDGDGMELPRAIAWVKFCSGSFGRRGNDLKSHESVIKTIYGEVPETMLPLARQIDAVLRWLLRLHPVDGGVEFVLAAAEGAFALVPKERQRLTPELAEKLQAVKVGRNNPGYDWQSYHAGLLAMQAATGWRVKDFVYGIWLGIVEEFARYTPQLWTPALRVRHWKLLRWLDEPVRSQERGGDSGIGQDYCLPRQRPGLIELCLAHVEGGSTESDIVEQLLGEHGADDFLGRQHFPELQTLSARKLRAEFKAFGFLVPLVDKCRGRILEVELTRGDNPTAASAAALNLGTVEGIANLVAVLRTLGKRDFVRGWARDNCSMETVMSHLARCGFPLATETAADFIAQVKAARIKEERLVELAVYAPQWAALVEQALGWEMLTEAVWWIHAHTKGTDWTVGNDIRELWQADMNARTSLTAADLLEGGVDVAWFHRIFKVLGAKRWEPVYEAAKFASTGTGHARARLFADAMLGDVTKKELIERITKKRHQDAVRAIGLLPLAGGAKRENDMLDRYKVIQEFRRGSKEFGSQRQASEKRAAQIGQQNLARTAGYPDPIRLEWAMEAKAVEDLAEGPIEVEVDGVKVSLGIDAWGEIEMNVSKDGKALADIPAKLKQHAKIAPLRGRKVELKRQASRIRPSLELFMVRGDEVSGAELCELMEHPLLAPMLKNLVVVGEGIKGYPTNGGKTLANHAGEVEAIKTGEKLRLAHPGDLLPAADWHRWQKDCFARERIQPFKQVFREFYPLTQTEKQDSTQTRRYSGHQVQPRQALALLGQRGWLQHPEEGVRKVYHEAGFVAWLTFEQGYFTPAEVEGLTLDSAFFTRRSDHKPVKLEELPLRLFSETMRDLDLVVSVAHRGGVDPEASASTIEMRATLVQETTQLLKLKNVQVRDRYALIKGELGEYSVHLGSAVTRKMPGEALFIIPVHSQHRGRLFLPFADDDPRSAEVMSKVLLLARDKEIKDPGILDQIRSA